MHKLALLIFSIAVATASAQELPQPTTQMASMAAWPEEQRSPDVSGPGWRGRADSIEILLAEIQVRQASLALDENTIWKRLIPRMTVSAGFGLSDIAFIDPLSSTTSILPRDSYRLTLSFSVNDILDSRREGQAHIALEESIARLDRLRAQQATACVEEYRKRTAARDELHFLREELVLIQQLVRYYEIQFEQGEIRFDTLVRSRLQLLSTRANILRLEKTVMAYD